MRDLRVSISQMDILWEDEVGNRDKIFQDIKSVSGKTDLLVFPEMFNTGFSMNPENLYSGTADLVSDLKNWASEFKVAVCGSLIFKEGDDFYNRFVFISPSGGYAQYDKRHLFSYADEEKHFVAGNEKLIINWNDWKICPMICYDLRFPAFARNSILGSEAQYDVLIYVANWPARRATAWKSLLKARSIENIAYVLGANRSGSDGNNIDYVGDSVVHNPLGIEILNMGAEELIETVSLSKEYLIESRNRFSFLNDADSYEIKGASVRHIDLA